MCNHCLKDKESVVHLFWDCPHVRPVWDDLKIWLRSEAATDVNISKERVLLGFPQRNNHPLNVIFIITKFYIFNRRLNLKQPNFKEIQRELLKYYKLTKYAKLNFNVDMFNKYRSSCHPLVR